MEPIYLDESMGYSTQSAMWANYWWLWLGLSVVFIVAYWKIFTKANKPGWYSLVPFLNLYVIFEIAGMNGWWFLAMFIPFVNIVVAVLLAINLAKAFGKSAAYGLVWLFLLSVIGILMLAFGDAKYQLGMNKPVEVDAE